MQSVKIEFLEKYNKLAQLAEKGHDNFPDEICNYIVDDYELHSMILFKIAGNNELIVLGKSQSAKKNYTKGSSFTCSVCKSLKINDLSINFHSGSECEIPSSEFVMNEACGAFNISGNLKGFVKFAKKTPFIRSEVESLQTLTEFLSFLFKVWTTSRGIDIISDKSTSEIINSISQELRTPANSIIGFASLLSEDSLTSSQTEYVGTIKNNAQNLLLLINDIIDLSKIDSGKIKENKTPIEIRTFIDDLIKVFNDKVDKSRIEILSTIDDNIPEKVIVDQQKLRYILLTIFTQSLRFTERGKISIRLSLNTQGGITFRIADTGRGIPSDKLNTIFDPFALSNLDAAKNGNHGGLGLTLVKKYLNLLGGDISVESTLGKGTSFTFALKSELNSTVSELENKLSQLPPPGSKNKILVIEDDYATSKLLSNYLNKWGYEPTIVNTAEQTLNMIGKEKFLAVIMDIALPNSNGLELLKQINEHPNTKNTPVIVCSVEAEQQKAFMMGAVEYFQKPVKYSYLVEVLQSYRLKKDSNILCVDDDHPTLNLVRQAIESAGFNAVAENISANVMERIKDIDLDLAIVDLDMPHPNGFELIKIIKSEKKFAKLPIVIYTGKENFQEELKKIEGLFEDLLSKRSTKIEDLADLISQMVNRYDTPAPAEEVIAKDEGVKILLAEDYKHSQIIVTRLLKKNSFENIIVVENGEEALEYAKKQKFDLILMDMQMPVMNGFEATEKIRQIPNYKDTPIIALTAFAMKGDREKCLEAGVTDYIPKPIDSKEFIEKVKHYTGVAN